MPSPLDPRQLQNFVALAQERSYTKAAKVVNLSQSAISHSVRALEKELNCMLIQKAGRTLILTEFGEIFRREALDILNRMDSLRTRIEEMGRWGRGRLRIGAGATACQYFLPPVLRELQETFPRCDLVVHPGDTPKSLEALREGLIDVAILVRFRDNSDCTFQRLFTDEMRLAFTSSHPCNHIKTLGPEHFEGQPLLQYSRGSATYELTAAYFEAQGIRIGRSMELGSMEAIREMARIGHGLALLPDWLLRNGSARGLVSRPLPGPPLRRDWGMAHLKGKTLSLLEETFFGLCAEQARIFTGKNRIEIPANAFAAG